jgi:hypothetical protein
MSPANSGSDSPLNPRRSKTARSDSASYEGSSLPCGVWKGKLSEGKSSREAVYELSFYPNGLTVDGVGPDGCTILGSAEQRRSMLNVTWTETHTWGTITVTGGASLDDFPVRLTGKFKASDGGGGKIDLRFTS